MSPRLVESEQIEEISKINFKNTEESIKKLQDPENKRIFNAMIQCLLSTHAIHQLFDQNDKITETECNQAQTAE